MYTYGLKKNNKLKHPYIHIRHEKQNAAGPGEGSCVFTLPHPSLLPQFHSNCCPPPPPHFYKVLPGMQVFLNNTLI